MAAKKRAEMPAEKGAQEKPRFQKNQILASANYQNRRDLADALLEYGKLYTLEEVDEKISCYLKGKVR